MSTRQHCNHHVRDRQYIQLGKVLDCENKRCRGNKVLFNTTNATEPMEKSTAVREMSPRDEQRKQELQATTLWAISATTELRNSAMRSENFVGHASQSCSNAAY
eukprot:TRINITY_DN52579_c0_g1_i1.p2 TRINITY_DN52579_c0_g1~~TRINITY_DN52579_c0_g1_i1.p2  ORF type:complete len:104 (+),score=3.63 TRINITY_DN52579_c0_g1_i1:126-437(+)